MQAFLQAKQQKENVGSLLVEIWSLYITEGLMGAIHGSYHRIRELYVPALDLSINLEGRGMNVFFSNGKRYAPLTKNSMGYGRTPNAKLLKTLILEGSQAEAIRNLAEIHLLFKGIQKDAKGVIENIFTETKKEEK